MKAFKEQEAESSSGENLSFKEVSMLYVRFLRIIGLLPFEGRNLAFIGTRLLLLYFFLSSLINVTMFVCFCLNSKEVRVDAISETVIVIGLNMRFYMMISKRYRLHDMLRESASLWSHCNEQGRLIVYNFERKLRTLFQLFAVSSCFINVLYPVNALFTKLSTLESNQTNTVHRILPYKWYGDNTAEHWPGYWPTFFLEMLVVQNSVVVGVTCDATSPFLMILGAGYLRHLRNQILASHQSPKPHLIRLIAFHRRILRYCAKIEKFARTMLLTQVLSTGYNISLILLKLVSPDRDKYKYLSILSVCVCQLYLCQWTPDHLFDESIAVSTAAYFAAVHWMPRQMGKCILLMITRAQRPVQMTAGGFVNLSLQSFGSMLTSAFSFFTVLRNLHL